MKVRLYDNATLELPLFQTFDERIKFVNNKILNDDKYKRYYNICALDLTRKEIKDIEKWWLGVKKVNQPLPIEILKTTLDYLTGYILGSKDFSTKPLISRYVELKKKRKNSKLTQKEKEEFNDLKDKIVYENRDFVFMNNEKMEKQLEKMLEVLKNKRFQTKTDEFMIKNIEKRLQNCTKIKEDVAILIENLGNLQTEKNDICDVISKDYELFQETKDENCLNSILRLANRIKEINKEINYYQNAIKEECEDYLLCTEFIYKTK